MERLECVDAGQWQLQGDKVFSVYSQLPAADTVAIMAGFTSRKNIWMPRTHIMPMVGGYSHYT